MGFLVSIPLKLGGISSLPFTLLFLVFLGIWLIALVQTLKRTDLDSTTKICWVIVLCSLNLLGLVLYAIWGPKEPERKPFRRLFEPPKKENGSDPSSPPPA